MFLYFYKILNNIYIKLINLNKNKLNQNINLNNSFFVLLVLKRNNNNTFFLKFDSNSNSFFLNDNLKLYSFLKNVVLRSFRYIKTNSKIYDFFLNILNLKVNIFYIVCIILFLLFYIFYIFDILNIFNLFNFLKNSNKLIVNDDILDKYLLDILKNNYKIFNIYHNVMDQVIYSHRILKGYLLTSDQSLKYFNLRQEDLLHPYFMYIAYFQYVSVNFINLSNNFINQILTIIPFFFNNSFLLVNIYIANLNNFFFDSFLLNNLKDFLFWFSWGIFYNKIFFIYFYSDNLLFNLNFYNYFYYKVENLKFIFDIEFDTFNLVEKKNIYNKNNQKKILLNSLLNFNSSKRWFCFQNYLFDDLLMYYNNEVNAFDYFDTNKKITYVGSLVDSRKYIKNYWLVLNNDYEFWLNSDYDNEM